MASVCLLDDAWIRRQLNHWFTKHHRNLPWRMTNDPYKIWISEIMLQQTQVATVLDFYRRFVVRFPDVESLASAPEQEVLQYWAGLGYYQRARNLHLAAKQIIQLHSGIFPRQPNDLQALAGIGRYTAGAIASFAFDLRAPILETNTIRFLSRLIGMTEPVQTTEALKQLWQVSESLLPRRVGSGKVNQAMMEIGSLVCTPVQPKCHACPLRSRCVAHQQGLENAIPVLKPKVTSQPLTHVGLLFLDEHGQMMIRRNPPGQWWAGLWDLPWIDAKTLGNKPLGTKQRQGIQHSFGDKVGIVCQIGAEHQSIRHAVTRYRILYRVYRARLVENLQLDTDWQWASGNNMPPVVARFRKINWQNL